jgi:hypothetical protein
MRTLARRPEADSLAPGFALDAIRGGLRMTSLAATTDARAVNDSAQRCRMTSENTPLPPSPGSAKIAAIVLD